MTFDVSSTVDAHLRDFAGAALTRLAQLAPSFVRTGGKIPGPGWHNAAPPDFTFSALDPAR